MVQRAKLATSWLFLFGIFFCQRSFLGSSGATTTRRLISKSSVLNSAHPVYKSIGILRGGESEYDEEEERDDFEDAVEDETEVKTTSFVADRLMSISKRVLVLVGKAAIVTTKAVGRAVKVGLTSEELEEDDEEEEITTITRIIRTIKKMWEAALNIPEGETVSAEISFERSEEKGTLDIEPSEVEVGQGTKAVSDFGTYLARTYHVCVDRDGSTPVLGGTIGDALREARSKARLLVAFIPGSRPGSSKKVTADRVAIRSLLSQEVAQAANKRARKKEEYGSFVLWGAKASSPEAITAIKRLKAKQPGSRSDKRPFLLVAYPAQVLDSSGVPKLVPKLLAQHHCSPPPSAESMAAYLNALRKRHLKQYSAMQHDLREAQLYKERTEGYKSSVASDRQRREKEKREEEERLALEKAESERIAALERRRQELRESLPEEPGKEIKDSFTIALRFADGRTGQRRFLPETPIQTLFNWVDAKYGMEREKVVLSAMTGQTTFSWMEEDSTTLGGSGLSRMTGLRVSEKKEGDGNSTVESKVAQATKS